MSVWWSYCLFTCEKILWPSSGKDVTPPGLDLPQGPTKEGILVQECYLGSSLNSLFQAFFFKIKVWRLYSFRILEILMDTYYLHIFMRNSVEIWSMCMICKWSLKINSIFVFCNHGREERGGSVCAGGACVSTAATAHNQKGVVNGDWSCHMQHSAPPSSWWRELRVWIPY